MESTISYSVTNNGKTIKCHCGKLFDAKKLKCPACLQEYEIKDSYLLLIESEV